MRKDIPHLAWGDVKPNRDDTVQVVGSAGHEKITKVQVIVTGDPKVVSASLDRLNLTLSMLLDEHALDRDA
jgi:hypothetical protein